MELRMRRAGLADKPLLMQLIAAFYRADHHDFDRESLELALPPLLRDDSFGVVWLLDAPVLGYAVVTWSYSLESGGREALLDEIYVAQQGKGVGSEFLQAIISDLHGREIQRFFLETELHNERVRGFYARHGFAADDSVWMSRDIVRHSPG
jgi:GNAT superfamily N-acetyltransferase